MQNVLENLIYFKLNGIYKLSYVAKIQYSTYYIIIIIITIYNFAFGKEFGYSTDN